MGNRKSCQVGNGQFETKDYPLNAKENEWQPIESLFEFKQNKEVKVTSLNDEQRIRAIPNDYHKQQQLYNIGRLKMQYIHKSHYKQQSVLKKELILSKGMSLGLGTGFIIHHKLNISYVLTAAHNIIHIDKYNKNKLIFPDNVWFEINQNTSNGFKTLSRFKGIYYHIHPKYIEYCKNNDIPETASGFDIAIIEIIDTANILNKITPFKLRLFKSSMLNSKNIKLIGYPGEQSLRGQLYGMKGNCNVDYISDNIQINKLIIYNNIDTSEGQSGSPIFNVKDNCIGHNGDEKEDDNMYQSYNEIIGIHVAGDRKCYQYNFGTAINDDILKWLYNITDGDLAERNEYECNALLITSSKSKYTKALNKIYKKFRNTKAINATRLYYDYNDNVMNNVTKCDILKYIENLFDDIYPRSSFIIYFCGESDKNGNWIINNKKHVITLNDINKLFKAKNNDSNKILNNIYEVFLKSTNDGNKLFIISDCSFSGNWVQIYNDNTNDYTTEFEVGQKHLYVMIQASCLPNELCQPGVFTEKYAQVCVQGESKKSTTAKNITKEVTAILGTLTVGTLYDGIVKQPYHKATKHSQPIVTKPGPFLWQLINGGFHIGNSYDGLYEIGINTFNNWYHMDVLVTRAYTGIGGLY